MTDMRPQPKPPRRLPKGFALRTYAGKPVYKCPRVGEWHWSSLSGPVLCRLDWRQAGYGSCKRYMLRKVGAIKKPLDKTGVVAYNRDSKE